jgi:hypothetical protein
MKPGILNRSLFSICLNPLKPQTKTRYDMIFRSLKEEKDGKFSKKTEIGKKTHF